MDTIPSDSNNSAVALAGPAALFATVPVKTEVGSCCTKTGMSFNCCEDVVSESGFEAVVGAAPTVARK